MGYDPAPGDSIQELFSLIHAQGLRISELERPSGTQVSGVPGFGSIGLSTTAFTIPTSYGLVASGTMDIPLGFTHAAILGIVSLGAWNGSATGDYVYVRCMIDGSPGSSVPEFAGASSYRAVGASAIRTLDGLTPGGTISVGVQCRAASGWGSNAANIANIDVIALFRR